MLCRRILTSTARLPIVNSTRQSTAIAISRRCYAAPAAGPKVKIHPLSGPIGDELDPRFSDLPWWDVPEINRQNLTETPVEPYYDQQNRRYYGEPVSENDEVLSVFAYDVHNHVTVPFALRWFFGFAAAFTGVCYLILYTWPGKIAVPRTFPYNGLENELGGSLPHELARKDPEEGKAE